MQPVRVSIAYCLECGYQREAFQLAEALVNEFQLLLSAVELVPWVNGAFDVRVDGELVHGMYRDGGIPDPATIIQAVRQRIGAPS